MKKVQYEKRATRNKCNMEIVKYEKNAAWREFTLKKYKTKKVKHECNATKVEKVKDEENMKSERNSDTVKQMQGERSAR